MGNKIRLFFSIISNSFNPDGYAQVTTTRRLGETATLISTKRRISQQRLNRVANGKINKISK